MYIASYYSTAGKHLFTTSSYETREQAAIGLFKLCHKANHCFTVPTKLINGEWQTWDQIQSKDVKRHNRKDFLQRLAS